MTASLTRFDALAQSDLPADVRRGAPRPLRGKVFRWTSTATFVLIGLGSGSWVAATVLCLVGVAVFGATPRVVERQLVKLGAEIDRLGGAQASAFLRSLPTRRLVALFAPFAWVTWQRARLHLRLGDAQAAAHAFRAAARQSGQPEHPALRSALAHALTLAGDLREAKQLLEDVQRRDALTPRDRLNFGVVLVSEPSQLVEAVTHLRAALAELPDEPRAQAALALALAKDGDVVEAQSAYDAAAERSHVDLQTQDLLKRARKTLRKLDGPKPAKARKKSPSTRKRSKAKMKTPNPQKVSTRVDSAAKTRARFADEAADVVEAANAVEAAAVAANERVPEQPAATPVEDAEQPAEAAQAPEVVEEAAREEATRAPEVVEEPAREEGTQAPEVVEEPAREEATQAPEAAEDEVAEDEVAEDEVAAAADEAATASDEEPESGAADLDLASLFDDDASTSAPIVAPAVAPAAVAPVDDAWAALLDEDAFDEPKPKS